jgi:hypothetical protein
MIGKSVTILQHWNRNFLVGLRLSNSTNTQQTSMSIRFEDVLKRLRLRDEDVVSCYLWGSRLWGTAKDRRSDWDMVIVLRDRDAPVTSSRAAEVDACLIGLHEFDRMMTAHKFRALACTLGPDEAVLKSSDPYRGRFRVVPLTLYQSVAAEVERDWERITKCFDKGDVSKGRQITGHVRQCFRHLQLGGVVTFVVCCLPLLLAWLLP